ncbi:MAG: tRNA 2-thiouridine(34) synthase MnmA [Waddliaceae bacterium]|nr:tRNA 2-thiouridine(34) synthase MnmA [Waddliaceae bacterium]
MTDLTKIDKPNTEITVAIGMSGGVDSSVAAYLLKKQGYNVIGLFMKNWEEEGEDGVCIAEEDFSDVSDVCEQLDIPYYSVNFSKKYWEQVFSPCLEEFDAGYTPNPDVLCNREIKFDALLNKAIELGADYLATGHYCQIQEHNGRHCLVRGKDNGKDQSYFLYMIKDHILEKVLFPIGGMEKPLVREIAKEIGLITATKKDSTGICFIGKRNFKSFLKNYIDHKPGNFETPEGRVVGTHDGLAFYTWGQRKGLGIGGPGEAWFVVGKNREKNTVTVVQGENHPLLLKSQIEGKELSWVGEEPQKLPYRCTAKLRYRQEDTHCTITKIEGDRIWVVFDQAQRAVTPRQSIVFYQKEICLGGAIIDGDSL